MQTILFWAGLSAFIFIAAFFFFFRAIQKKSIQNIYYSLVLLLIAGIMGARAGWLFMQKSYHEFTEVVKPRSGEEVYKGMFGNTSAGCVKLLHVLEPVVPRIDCCTYLEFTTCPGELKKIIARNKYVPATSDAGPGTPPVWWRPQALGKDAVALSFSPDEDSYELLVFSADSMHAFYCYSTD